MTILKLLLKKEVQAIKPYLIKKNYHFFYEALDGLKSIDIRIVR